MRMNRLIGWIVGASIVAASMLLSGVAVATAPSGTIVSEVIGAGSMSNGVGFAAVPGTNTVVADFTFGPNSSTGWHTHPGKTLVTVKSGTFTVYHAKDCAPNVYGPGDAFVELPSSVHVGRNETSGDVELGVVFFGVPIGGSPRIDQPQPAGCAITQNKGKVICGVPLYVLGVAKPKAAGPPALDDRRSRSTNGHRR